VGWREGSDLKVQIVPLQPKKKAFLGSSRYVQCARVTAWNRLNWLKRSSQKKVQDEHHQVRKNEFNRLQQLTLNIFLKKKNFF